MLRSPTLLNSHLKIDERVAISCGEPTCLLSQAQ